jgi:catechol 2,3-dioxygenase-like lactoylglutathione lyase family enzyme
MMDRRTFLQAGTLVGAASTLALSAECSVGGESNMQIRVARPTDRLTEVISFYRDGLGLPVIGHFENHAGYSGVMLGMQTERFHLEFTHAEGSSPCPAPTKDNLLVLYLENTETYTEALVRMQKHGYFPVEPENPYWKGKSQTFEDPDGWRVVLYHGRPFGDQ